MYRSELLKIIGFLDKKYHKEIEEDEHEKYRVEQQLQRVEIINGRTVRTYQDYLIVPAKELGKPDKRFFVREYKQ